MPPSPKLSAREPSIHQQPSARLRADARSSPHAETQRLPLEHVLEHDDVVSSSIDPCPRRSKCCDALASAGGRAQYAHNEQHCHHATKNNPSRSSRHQATQYPDRPCGLQAQMSLNAAVLAVLSEFVTAAVEFAVSLRSSTTATASS
jgi:hypothetical protein